MPRFGSVVEMKAGLTVALASVSANTTLTAGHNVVLASAASASITITLPTAVGATGRVYTIKRSDASSNTLTVATTSSQTINGATTVTDLISQDSYLTVVSDGANWQIIGYYVDPPKARISRSTTQSMASGSNTNITLATVDWQTTPTMVASTTTLQPVFPGMYAITGTAIWTIGVAGYYQARVLRGGTSGTFEACESANVGTGVTPNNTASTVVNVTAAQLGTSSAQFTLNGFQNTGSAVNITSAYLEMTYLGPAM